MRLAEIVVSIHSIPDQVLSFHDCILSSYIVKIFVPWFFPVIRVFHVNLVPFFSFLLVVKLVCNFRQSEITSL